MHRIFYLLELARGKGILFLDSTAVGAKMVDSYLRSLIFYLNLLYRVLGLNFNVGDLLIS